MAQYNGFKCDFCGKVFDPEERTKITTRFEGKIFSGDYAQDACPDCAIENKPQDAELRPLRRRRTKSEQDEDDEPVGVSA